MRQTFAGQNYPQSKNKKGCTRCATLNNKQVISYLIFLIRGGYISLFAANLRIYTTAITVYVRLFIPQFLTLFAKQLSSCSITLNPTWHL